MAAGLGIQAIRGRGKPPIDGPKVLRSAEQRLTQYGHALQRRLQKYPPQEPTDYERTGDLGRGWTAPGALTVTATTMTLVNRMSSRRGGKAYAVYVQGPDPGPAAGQRQAAVMKAKGWESVTDVAKATRADFRDLAIKAIRGEA